MSVHLLADHALAGYGGTWSRRWTLSLHIGPFWIGFTFDLARSREKRHGA